MHSCEKQVLNSHTRNCKVVQSTCTGSNSTQELGKWSFFFCEWYWYIGLLALICFALLRLEKFCMLPMVEVSLFKVVFLDSLGI